MLCSAENSPCCVGTRQSLSVMDQSLGWRRSCSHESQTTRRAYTGKDCPKRRHNPKLLGPLALSCTPRAAQHSRCFALQWLACVRMATSAHLLHQTNWLPASSDAVFVHAYRTRSPSSSSSMHHERMAHILSPEVLPHPRSLLTRATFSRRFGCVPSDRGKGPASRASQSARTVSACSKGQVWNAA